MLQNDIFQMAGQQFLFKKPIILIDLQLLGENTHEFNGKTESDLITT